MQLAPGIDYIKWDCNRVIQSFGSTYLGAQQDRFFVEYCQGLYNVMRRIREKYPRVLVQCCSSGGGRVDYGSLRYCNEIWTSDNTDARSRAFIQYGTSLIYPACVMGSHVSTVPNHQTGNVTPLKFRFDMACAGRLGMELQPKNLSADERALADRCIRSYKQYRVRRKVLRTHVCIGGQVPRSCFHVLPGLRAPERGRKDIPPAGPGPVPYLPRNRAERRQVLLVGQRQALYGRFPDGRRLHPPPPPDLQFRRFRTGSGIV